MLSTPKTNNRGQAHADPGRNNKEIKRNKMVRNEGKKETEGHLQIPKIEFWELERGLRGQKHLPLLQKTRVLFQHLNRIACKCL